MIQAVNSYVTQMFQKNIEFLQCISCEKIVNVMLIKLALCVKYYRDLSLGLGTKSFFHDHEF